MLGLWTQKFAPRRSKDRRGALPSKLPAACGTAETADDSLISQRSDLINSQGASLLLDLQFQGTTISRRVFGEAVLQETGIGNQFPVALPKVTGRQAAAVLQAQNLADFEGNDTGIGVAKFSGQGRTLSAEISAFGG